MDFTSWAGITLTVRSIAGVSTHLVDGTDTEGGNKEGRGGDAGGREGTEGRRGGGDVEEGGEGRGSGTGGCRPSVRLSTEVWTGEHAAGGPQAQGLASDVQVGRGRLGRKGWRETLTPSTEKGVPEGPDPRQGGRAIAESRWRPRGPA